MSLCRSVTIACCHPLLKDEPESFLPQWCWSNTTDCTTTTSGQVSTVLPNSSAAPKKKPASYTSQLPVTTAVAQKPVTTSSIPPPPPPKTTEPVTTKAHTTPAPEPTTSITSSGDGGNGGSGWTIGGFGTYFYQNGNYGYVFNFASRGIKNAHSTLHSVPVATRTRIVPLLLRLTLRNMDMTPRKSQNCAVRRSRS